MIKIFDSSLNFVGEIDDFKTCIITRKYRGIETLEMTVPLTSLNVLKLKKHYVLYAGPQKVYEILHRQIDTTDEDLLSVIAYGFGKTLAKRITVPPTGYGYDTASGSYDAIVKQYINHNVINPEDNDRTISYIQTAAVQTGTNMTDQTRLKNLHDEVCRVLAIYDAGYYFDLDVETKKIIFDTYTGTDRRTGNGTNPPAIFAVEYDNILTQTYTDSSADMQNIVYVGGQGEGKDRTIVKTGSASGIHRFETFLDARDTDDTEELHARGESSIVAPVSSFNATVNPYSNLTYQVDYDLGDMVTVQSQRLRLVLNTRITEIRESYQQGFPDGLEITFGQSIPTFLENVKRQREQIAQLASL